MKNLRDVLKHTRAVLERMKKEQQKREAALHTSKDRMASLADAEDQDIWAWVASDVCSPRPSANAVIHCAHKVVDDDTLRLVRCLLERARTLHGPVTGRGGGNAAIGGGLHAPGPNW